MIKVYWFKGDVGGEKVFSSVSKAKKFLRRCEPAGIAASFSY